MGVSAGPPTGGTTARRRPPMDASVERLAERRPGAPWTLLVGALAVMATLVASGVLLSAVPLALEGRADTALLAAAASLASYALAGLAAWAVVRRVGRAAVGLHEVRGLDLPLGAALALGLLVLQLVVLAGARAVPGLQDAEPANAGAVVDARGLTLVLLALVAVVAAPLVEEVVFRGMLLRWGTRVAGFWVAALATSVLFGLLHVPGGEGGSASRVLLAVLTGLLGLVGALVVRWTDRLAPSVALHATRNGIAVGLIVLVQALS